MGVLVKRTAAGILLWLGLSSFAVFAEGYDSAARIGISVSFQKAFMVSASGDFLFNIETPWCGDHSNGGELEVHPSGEVICDHKIMSHDGRPGRLALYGETGQGFDLYCLPDSDIGTRLDDIDIHLLKIAGIQKATSCHGGDAPLLSTGSLYQNQAELPILMGMKAQFHTLNAGDNSMNLSIIYH